MRKYGQKIEKDDTSEIIESNKCVWIKYTDRHALLQRTIYIFTAGL